MTIEIFFLQQQISDSHLYVGSFLKESNNEKKMH